MGEPELPEELRRLVHDSVARLGEVIERQLGRKPYLRIERLRRRMSDLRGRDPAFATPKLWNALKELRQCEPVEQHSIALAFSLMLELINSCENAYRTWRLRGKAFETRTVGRGEIVLVLTAHPTEARAPENIEIFHSIQSILTLILKDGLEAHEAELRHSLELAWRIEVARNRKPRVKDEAEHIYSTTLRPELLDLLLELQESLGPVYLRSWVGGDKDGHPGVNEKTLQESLQLSRNYLLQYASRQLKAIAESLNLIFAADLTHALLETKQIAASLKILKEGDGQRISETKRSLKKSHTLYCAHLGVAHPGLNRLEKLFQCFPGLVVPLELRESSEVLMETKQSGKLTVAKMLRTLKRIARGGDPKWYARGVIISMASQLSHIQAMARIQFRELGSLALPIVPLFEQAAALALAPKIVTEMIADPRLKKAIRMNWGGRVEVMLGYSDSSKEAGVLSSRVELAVSMQRLDQLFSRLKVEGIFFHGSGGSVDRGGGSVQDQISWWPASALKTYKATIQGEMVERSFASPEILRGQVGRLAHCVSDLMKSRRDLKPSPQLIAFSQRVSSFYRGQIGNPEFLAMTEAATPYRYLSVLRMGSRPTKRAGKLTVGSLRAIPWILCWTQTRVLFPTWWGVGSAWAEADSKRKIALKKAFNQEPMFRSFINALGFTLAKVELPIWEVYLRQGLKDQVSALKTVAQFESEYKRTLQFYRAITGKRDLLWFKPWLGKSISLRSPMIHPLNLIQLLALERGDGPLIRLTATGIAMGMLTTG